MYAPFTLLSWVIFLTEYLLCTDDTEILAVSDELSVRGSIPDIAVAPAGPVGPGTPSKPAFPCGPGIPSKPAFPCGPVGPSGPVTPITTPINCETGTL